jgi:hypothetical protein
MSIIVETVFPFQKRLSMVTGSIIANECRRGIIFAGLDQSSHLIIVLLKWLLVPFILPTETDHWEDST